MDPRFVLSMTILSVILYGINKALDRAGRGDL